MYIDVNIAATTILYSGYVQFLHCPLLNTIQIVYILYKQNANTLRTKRVKTEFCILIIKVMRITNA